ncbi:hypothetical protein K2V74_06965 [Mammaliicoccus sciuri]|uniref:cyclophilin-like fold protein n=1 Tax=Mammaliicoccus sciuri TaxID=1296 RepID=UPI001E3BA120|nr:cyclophilin-like fold protein [Mammaliicoccus sciuri]MCD8874057.1 hypothetical protein [Mammaliicoccus sciuri]
MNKIKVDIDSIRCNLNIIESDTTKKLIDHLPLTMTMEDLNKNEKYYFFNLTLPIHSKKVKKIKKGDVMLYGDNCLVIFYKDFETNYAYTPIGKLENFNDFPILEEKSSITVSFEKYE